MRETQEKREWKTRSRKAPERRVWSMGDFPFQDSEGVWVTRERRRTPDRRGSYAGMTEEPAPVMTRADGTKHRLAILAATLAVVAVLWSVTNKGVIASVANTVGSAF